MIRLVGLVSIGIIVGQRDCYCSVICNVPSLRSDLLGQAANYSKGGCKVA